MATLTTCPDKLVDNVHHIRSATRERGARFPFAHARVQSSNPNSRKVLALRMALRRGENCSTGSCSNLANTAGDREPNCSSSNSRTDSRSFLFHAFFHAFFIPGRIHRLHSLIRFDRHQSLEFALLGFVER